MKSTELLSQPLRRRLDAIAGLEATDDDGRLGEAARDFGGLAQGAVRTIVRPRHVEALVELVRVARDAGLPLTPRGLGLSQSGQSIANAGVTVELAGFDRIDLDVANGVVRCGTGATWRRILAVTAASGLAPEVMPFNLDLTVGGTLSAGGIGSTSHQRGFAVSSVAMFDAVTGAAEHVEASPDGRRDVYDAMLGGLGQFGFITEVVLRLRPMLPLTRTYCLLYDDLAAMIADECSIMNERWCVHLEGFASAAIQGLRRGPQGRRMPFARWFAGLHVSTEFTPGDPPPDDELLRGLNYRERLLIEDTESTEYAARYDLRFEAMRATGAWQQIHPWIECMLSADAATALLPKLIPSLPLLLGDGHRVMPVADVPRPAFVMQPARGPTIGLAILPVGVPRAFEGIALDALRRANEQLLSAGGKRYLSGWLFEPDEAAWERHYGANYDAWRERKRELDPSGILRSALHRS